MADLSGWVLLPGEVLPAELEERMSSRVQPAPERCPSEAFAGTRCHRDAGHTGAHVSYAEHGPGKIGWHNDRG